MKIAVLGSHETVLAFRLAGVRKGVRAEESREALLGQFEKLAGEEGIGLIIADDSCSQIRDEITTFIELNQKPLIIEIPGRNEKITGGVAEMIIKKATGAK
ncbi:MAG: V-type ATP synthase subunit F [Candidatus Diapherotrites archaeon]|nr:V-type ATP synthase subunit F [Candidatus Diapherotrites archaeon]